MDFDATVEATPREDNPHVDASSSTIQHKRGKAELEDTSSARLIAGTLGRDLSAARKRRRLTQAELGRRIGLSGARIGELERGGGATAPLEVWVRLGDAIHRPLVATFYEEDESQGLPDADHLVAQEFVLGRAHQHGRKTDVDLVARPADLSRSIDVVLQDDIAQALILVQIWNRIDDVEAAIHSTNLWLAESSSAAALAALNGSPYRVAACWLLLVTAANRRTIAREPEVLDLRFPGSSVRWARCLADGAPPPNAPGIAWINPREQRIVPLRRRRT